MTTDAWGIDDGWFDVDGRWHDASPDTISAIRAAIGEPADRPVWVVRPGHEEPLLSPCHLLLEDATDLGVVDHLPPDLPLGIHRLAPVDGGPVTTVLAGPGQCHLPEDLREWGVAVQVPTARSSTSWGIGDLADVRALAEWIGARGGRALGLSPLHAPTPVAPIAASPYYPSSRRWRSPLLIRVDEVGGRSTAADPQVPRLAQEARALLADPIVRRDACWSLQRTALEHLWATLPDDERSRTERWRRAQGADLEPWARYCALAERHGASWRRWPAELRHPGSPAVARAAGELSDRVAFHAWLQHLVDDQLTRARSSGVRLIEDLAVGIDPGGADAWTWQELMAFDFSVGAPPDEFERDGQSWGLPPWIPWRLRDAGYQPLATVLRAAMSGGGGLRIDHVMGLTRIFWVPEGGSPADGAYVRFPGHELLEVVALESARTGAVVVGEDLGTVEAGLREQLAERRILSTKVVWFEDSPPEAWPAASLAMVTTHDLPTLAGMVGGTDAPAAMRAHLESMVGPVDDRPVHDVAVAAHERLARSPSAVVLGTLEDLLGVDQRPNLPGTTDDERPNWSVALPVPIEELPVNPAVDDVVGALAATRSD